MSELFVLATVFAVFIPALMLPGPDFVAVVRSSMTHGTRAGLLTTVGVSAGLCLYATLSILGLSALLIEYQWLTWLVRILGGGYLIYLGIKLLRSRPEPIDLGTVASPTKGRSLTFGFLVTLTNPKAIVLFASVFATAITPATPGWVMVAMIGLVTTSSLVWYTLVSVLMSAPPVMRRMQNAKHRIEKAAGICFIGLGGKVIADARTPLPG
ncbi:LysE family translocator [Litoreibacter roseus]|uniref:Threonine efflux protein n=1 Tax=Litoreibacter roseus TaxID=2601869 RepID=A0A6N6JHY1_9RHOB|nr:LysE family translocator [Litoreibacter roseus]GFE65876.1 threonine efflux protein [Litoreibacter roseus]